MSTGVAGLVLLAAVLHASWNALLRSDGDRFWRVTVMGFVGTAVMLPFVLLLPVPAAASWPYLAASAVVQVLYSLFLVRCYRVADLGSVYPVIRGGVPLLVCLGAALFAGERPRPVMLLGILLVSLGVVAMALGRHSGGATALGLAGATSALIACYTVIDGVGVRLAGDSVAYTAWIYVVYGALLPACYLAVRGRVVLRGRRAELGTAAAAGIGQLLTYAVMTFAFRHSALGPVSALRETSVVFAALIGWRFLGERFSTARAGACVAITLGACCLSYFG
jgi:drug/metabolite transporter (DMT)-like permease